MNIAEIQADLRHFVAERDLEGVHSPKNLAMALAVDAAGVAEPFQWRSDAESLQLPDDPEAKARLGGQVAGVLLRLLQLADHTQIDIVREMKTRLAADALAQPRKREVARVSPEHAAVAGTHVLLDFENVQPREDELRAMVPEASQVWLFHGPHQVGAAARYASFGDRVTAVPISKTGKNALDFHLAFYMGYVASKNQATTMVVVANDKGYGPMLEHARALGFDARQVGYAPGKPGRGIASSAVPAKAAKAGAKKAGASEVAAKKVTAKTAAKVAAVKPAANKAASKKAVAKKTVAKNAVAKQTPTKRAAPKQAASKTAAVKTVAARGAAALPAAAPAPVLKPSLPQPPLASRARPSTPAPAGAAAGRAEAPSSAAPSAAAPVVAVGKLTDSLRNMSSNRPSKPAALRRLLKSLVGASATDASVERALQQLMDAGVVRLDAAAGVLYPRFGTSAGRTGLP